MVCIKHLNDIGNFWGFCEHLGLIGIYNHIKLPQTDLAPENGWFGRRSFPAGMSWNAGVKCSDHGGYIIYIFSKISLYPIPSMYVIFTYIYHKDQPNVGKYTLHWMVMDGMGIYSPFCHLRSPGSLDLALSQGFSKNHREGVVVLFWMMFFLPPNMGGCKTKPVLSSILSSIRKVQKMFFPFLAPNFPGLFC